MLESKGKKKCSTKKFYCYLCLDMGMLIVRYNDIKIYWAEGAFLGHSTFSETMPPTRFQEIHGAIPLMLQSSYDRNTANDDSLWSCRSVLDQFI